MKKRWRIELEEVAKDSRKRADFARWTRSAAPVISDKKIS
jgi:hypothetical protein